MKEEERKVQQGQSESLKGGEGEKWQTCWCYRNQKRAFKMAQTSAEKLKHSGLAERKG